MADKGKGISLMDRDAMRKAKERWDSVSKPKASLGILEDLIVQIAGVIGTEEIDISRRVCVVFAADNGIVEERISQSSQDLTAAVATHIACGRGNINTMAKAAGCDVVLADVGILSQYLPVRPETMIDLHVAEGTRNFLLAPAMTDAEAHAAFGAGITMAERICREGYTIAAVGEMGIGNTTTSAAVTAALLGIPPHQSVDRGGGLDDEGLLRKRDVVKEGLIKHGLMRPEPVSDGEIRKADKMSDEDYAWKVLCCVGGLDIAAIAGFITGCAGKHIPVVLDGFITAAAALVAARMDRRVTDFLIASHMGREKGMEALYRELGLIPVLHAGLALGEGTGAVLLFPILDVAVFEYRSALTFDQMGFATDYKANDGIRVFTK